MIAAGLRPLHGILGAEDPVFNELPLLSAGPRAGPTTDIGLCLFTKRASIGPQESASQQPAVRVLEQHRNVWGA